MKQKSPEELADEHWEWVVGLLDMIKGQVGYDTCEYLYKTAFAHGFKHGKEN